MVQNNHLKSHPDKCHSLFSTKHLNIKTVDYRTSNCGCEKLLGVKIDVNLNFNNQMSHLCEKASWKIFVLASTA